MVAPGWVFSADLHCIADWRWRTMSIWTEGHKLWDKGVIRKWIAFLPAQGVELVHSLPLWWRHQCRSPWAPLSTPIRAGVSAHNWGFPGGAWSFSSTQFCVPLQSFVFPSGNQAIHSPANCLWQQGFLGDPLPENKDQVPLSFCDSQLLLGCRLNCTTK